MTALPAASAALAGEDRQREIPGADRHEHPAPVHGERVILSRRAGKLHRMFELAARFAGVIAQEIDRLAHLGNTVEQRLARLALAQAEEFIGVILEQVRRFFEQQRTLCAAQRIPAGLDRDCTGKGGIDFLGSGIAARADLGGEVVRHGDRRGFSGRLPRESRPCAPFDLGKLGQPRLQRRDHQRVRQVDALAVEPLSQDILRQRDRRVAARVHRGELGNRIARQFLRRNTGIAHAVDKAGVGPVLEQAAHQIGEQFLVPANRCIDPHRGGRVAFELVQRVIDFLAHAVEPLKLK